MRPLAKFIIRMVLETHIGNSKDVEDVVAHVSMTLWGLGLILLAIGMAIGHMVG